MNQDPVFKFIEQELIRQRNQIELIASENIVSLDVMRAQGSVLTNKYAEGYPQRRYYGGCEAVDEVEQLAIDRLKTLFSCVFANVQPHSGAQANQAVMLALLEPGDVIMGLDLASGGHLTHGASVNLSGKWFKSCSYGVDPETHLIDYNVVREQAKLHKPKVIITGGSSYTRIIDFKIFREIADEVGAYFWVDMAHFAGLVAGGVYPSPLPYAHVVTSTTHKTLRGPRGGVILSQDEALGKKINSAVFPGLQGGPLMHVIAAKAVAFQEALSPSFKSYAEQIVKNAKVMESVLKEEELTMISGGTDSHLLVVDLRKLGITGQEAAHTLEECGLTCNKNGIPNDPLPPVKTSGIRLGTPAGTTRGFEEAEFRKIAHSISLVLKNINDPSTKEKVKEMVNGLCQAFPLYPGLSYN